MSVKIWRHWNVFTSLAGVSDIITSLETVWQLLKTSILTYLMAHQFHSKYLPERNEDMQKVMYKIFHSGIVVVFILGHTGNSPNIHQPRDKL